LIKIISNEFHSVTVFSSEVVRAPIPRPRVVAGDATRRPSVILGFRVDAFLSFPEPYPFRPVPFFLLALELSQAPSRNRCRRRAGHPLVAPLRFLTPKPP